MVVRGVSTRQTPAIRGKASCGRLFFWKMNAAVKRCEDDHTGINLITAAKASVPV